MRFNAVGGFRTMHLRPILNDDKVSKVMKIMKI